MTVVTYKSTDSSAPVLTGQSGALITVLDAILVNGYGSKAAAGWTKAFSATNKAVYRMATSGNSGFYLNVQDGAPATAKEARIWGYEAATAQDTGTAPFPTVAQMATGLFARKSNTADSTARAWYCVADNSVFYFFADTGDFTAPAYSLAFAFGDIFSYKSSDAYKCIIMGRDSENTSSVTNERLPSVNTVGSGPAFPTTLTGHYIARSWTGTGASIAVGKHAVAMAMSSSSAGANAVVGAVATASAPSPQVTYPNGPDSALLLSPIWIHHSNAVRGYLKGLWAPCHSQPLSHGDTFSGTGNMSGKTFLALNVKGDNGASQSPNGQIMIETSDTWS